MRGAGVPPAVLILKSESIGPVAPRGPNPPGGTPGPRFLWLGHPAQVWKWPNSSAGLPPAIRSGVADATGIAIFRRVASLGKILVVTGLGMALLGVLLWLLGPRLGSGPWLPGDLSFRRGNFSFHFPIITCLVLSIVLTLLARLFQR